ncbi:MAG TPA: P1 family peptidase [Dyella sp.]|uniref:DmpA family aminopeptidase n=1 Tax=Dyella sp. TaxID=1869338 RepID=UPI002D7699A8|nr:P1 family peptidase [Dyella sp.]HET6553124.1 P1 family peptidase [Dyella sp.]
MPRFRYALALYLLCSMALAAEPRARGLGIPFDGSPGPLNAITDVAGVTVGQVTLIEDLQDGHKVRTGVTAILPRGRGSYDTPAFGGWFALNGNGEMTGTAWLDESGQLEGPIMLTNTHSVGVVRDAVIAERVHAGGADASGYWWSLPVVAETWDGDLNDINGFHVRAEHAAKALHDARGGPVAEGNVGGGTGMICHEFKCGIGTSSRRVTMDGQTYTVGVLVQANYGLRESLRIAGVPVGQYLIDDRIRSGNNAHATDTGSIIIVVATDAPLLPHQLKRLAKRAGMGLARMGSFAGNGSGDIFIAFSTANPAALRDQPLQQASFIGNDHIDPLFEATAQAAEESIVNAMVAARDMRGEGGHYAMAIPHGQLIDLLKRFGRYQPPH